jgi:hypothetical protein
MTPSEQFEKWFEEYEEILAASECSKSYYDSDTGYTDEAAARHDEMRAAFEAGYTTARQELEA